MLMYGEIAEEDAALADLVYGEIAERNAILQDPPESGQLEGFHVVDELEFGFADAFFEDSPTPRRDHRPLELSPAQGLAGSVLPLVDAAESEAVGVDESGGAASVVETPPKRRRMTNKMSPPSETPRDASVDGLSDEQVGRLQQWKAMKEFLGHQTNCIQKEI